MNWKQPWNKRKTKKRARWEDDDFEQEEKELTGDPLLHKYGFIPDDVQTIMLDHFGGPGNKMALIYEKYLKEQLKEEKANPNEDTEWNDELRRRGIIPQKEAEVTEDDIIKMVETTVQEKSDGNKKSLDEMNLDELDELEDEEEEKILLELRNKRILEMKIQQSKARYGEVKEISAVDYVDEVNNAGEGVWVILHLYKQGIPLCAKINQYMTCLAAKFPSTKFIKSVSTVCIHNYPDKNVPTIFIYFEGKMMGQMVGPISLRGINLTIEEFEYLLGHHGAVQTSIKKDPHRKIKDVTLAQLGIRDDDEDDESD